jgi:DNA-binding FadR family transcriptional regulator
MSAQQRRIVRRPSESRKERKHDQMARDLGTAIVAGRYQPGESIPGEIASSQQYKVSRNAYREAVRILAAKGLVESRQKAGTLVTPRDRWNLLDPEVVGWVLANHADGSFRDLLFELRMIVEPAAASLAAYRRNDADVLAMEEALASMGEAAPDSPEGEQADERFHAAILTAARNELLTRLASIVAASVSFVAEFKRTQHVTRDSWPDHKELFEAIKRGQPAEAHAGMIRLIAHAREDTDLAAALDRHVVPMANVG